MAEAVLRAEVEAAGAGIAVDSAGTGDWHEGEPMNTGALTQLTRRDYGGKSHRARQIDASWLDQRDLFLAMDSSNLADLRRMARATRNDASPGAEARIRLFGEVGGLGGADIPDPYGGSAADFAKVLEMLEAAAPHILAAVNDILY
jgi:protein-tyrosine phosphatase